MEYMVSLFKLFFTQHLELKQQTALSLKKNSAGQPTRTLHLYTIYLYTLYLYTRTFICRLDVTRAFCEERAGI